jgi:DNA topoisomerase-1
MSKNLVIVESPAKAKTIEGFLGKDYLVKSCFGHVMDLAKKDLGVDIENGYLPNYIIPPDKKKIVSELKKQAQGSEIIWLASDEDREGEAIAAHLLEALEVAEEKARRIVFHEITRPAILEAIEHPRNIDRNLVDAQQARRVLDRLVGFELSPLLWKKIKPALSAGRVQSVAVRLIVEREEEIRQFKPIPSFRIAGDFLLRKDGKFTPVQAELNKRFSTPEQAKEFLGKCIGAEFRITDTETKPAKKSPAPPFTTSTLQQEASRKLGFSVANTMRVAQDLYESGKITYMRTDSLNLSNLAIGMAKKEITALYGANYVKTRKYTTRTKGAQEAHEAIRPTYLNHSTIDGDRSHQRLYELIWKRTIASQMADALLEKTAVTISISKAPEKFIARGEVIRFDGFLKLYLESTDEEKNNVEEMVLPPMMAGDILEADQLQAQQKFTQQPPRYTEAMLVKKMEELGIGRPSTYAPTISTIQKRDYVVKEDRPGSERKYLMLILKNGAISRKEKTEKVGFEKSKLFPTDVGTLVNQFLLEYFGNILDYNFTALVEEEFDEIAQGKLAWNAMISDFYTPFHEQIRQVQGNAKRVSGERLLGNDPVTGEPVYVKIGRYGPMVQLGDADASKKPRFAGLKKGQSLDTLYLDDALDLFRLPRTLGMFEDLEVIVATGRFGPYVKHGGQFCSLPKTEDPLTITLDRAREIILGKRQADREKIIREFAEEPKMVILKGRFGPYISFNKLNYKIPKGKKAEELTFDDCRRIVAETKPAKSGKTRKSR